MAKARAAEAGEAFGCPERNIAAAPAACGAAMDVPEKVTRPVSSERAADVIDTPWPNRATAGPLFEHPVWPLLASYVRVMAAGPLLRVHGRARAPFGSLARAG
jgi:hypothetical protein